ncbi:zinc-ribbon domain-containing protein [Clostridium beijerinckii]|nr:zinc-ribbon domain-containing protein [Clostridium beijerinckii]
MFFIGIFGIENKDKEIKSLNNISCKKCNMTVTGNLIKNFDFFHFFFIPIFKWNEKYYVVCDKCKSVYIIPKDKGKAIEHGENIEISYWDVQEAYTDGYSNNYYDENKCKNCGAKVDSKFKYCPHCGAKI